MTDTNMVRKVVVSALVLGAMIYLVPSIWSYYLWRSYPDLFFERVEQDMARYGSGKECFPRFIDQSRPTYTKINECFSKSSTDQVYHYKNSDGDVDTSVTTFRCDSENFSGELYYLYYRSSGDYQCGYKIAERWEDIPLYRTGDVPASPPKLRFFTRILITIFG